MTVRSRTAHHGGYVGLAGLMLTLAGCSWLATTETGQDRLWIPLQLSQIETPGKVIPAQAATGGEASFIVKVKGHPEIDELARTWRRDQPAARRAFEEWSQGRGILGELELTGCSYSGELILTRRFAEDEVMTRASVNAVLEKIRSVESVAYADPDFTAYPGTEGK